MSKAACLRLFGALSEPVATLAELPSARAQADDAIGVGTPGRCVRFAQVRPRVVLDRLGDALAALPGLGPDPLLPLLDYDAKRRSDFARTLLAWLDCNGDAVSAAQLLGMPQNTLRYRVARAQQVLDADLNFSPTRIEIHLRLRTALQGTTSHRA
jgi:sugar diacid utilization regulator